VDNGVIRNWDDMELLWNYTFSCVLRAPPPHPSSRSPPLLQPALVPTSPLLAATACVTAGAVCRVDLREGAVPRGCVCEGGVPACEHERVRAHAHAGVCVHIRARAIVSVLYRGEACVSCTGVCAPARGVACVLAVAQGCVGVCATYGHVSQLHVPLALPCLLCRWHT
jgi:hypothetical protein